jgi:hypothetical protein
MMLQAQKISYGATFNVFCVASLVFVTSER